MNVTSCRDFLSSGSFSFRNKFRSASHVHQVPQQMILGNTSVSERIIVTCSGCRARLFSS